jgi:hypothetical protein
MRSVWLSTLSIALLAGPLVAQTAQPSLGDLARAQRAAAERNANKNGGKHVYTNDDLTGLRSSSDGVTVAPSPAGAAKSADSKEADKSATASSKNEKSNVKAVPAEETYRKDVQKQRAQIAQLEKDVDELQHKLKVQSTNYYFDAGSRLRDGKQWAEDREKMDKDIEAKQQKLAEARTKLDDLLEQARKLGIPSSALE